MESEIQIFTDGSSLGNPGPGGYGIVLKYKNMYREISQGYLKTTNNRMELLGVIEALKALTTTATDKQVRIHTDSKYVMDAVEKGWVFGWQRKNFKDKANADLWREFLKIYPKYKISFEWIKGHSGHLENERCDVLAKEAAQKENLLIDTGYENLGPEATLL